MARDDEKRCEPLTQMLNEALGQRRVKKSRKREASNDPHPQRIVMLSAETTRLQAERRAILARPSDNEAAQARNIADLNRVDAAIRAARSHVSLSSKGAR